MLPAGTEHRHRSLCRGAHTHPAPELVELSPEDPAPQFYPDSISWQEDGGQLLVVKQYSVPYGTVVADLTESGMQWGGSDYTLWGVTQSVEGGVTEEKEVTQDFELSVRSADAETARNDVKESVAYDDEYGFSGSLTLQDITIGETLQADSTYMATAHYAGTVTRTEAGTVHYTLLYAPISVPVVVAAAESGITPALLIMGIACALLFIAVLLIITHLLRKEPAHAVEPAKTAPAPKVYVPSGDIVLGGRNEDDDGDRMCGSFSSSVFNHRTDEYGGSAENRARFAVESVRAVRSRLPELPIDYKLAVRQEEPHYGNAGVVESELEILCQCSLVPVSPVFM